MSLEIPGYLLSDIERNKENLKRSEMNKENFSKLYNRIFNSDNKFHKSEIKKKKELFDFLWHHRDFLKDVIDSPNDVFNKKVLFLKNKWGKFCNHCDANTVTNLKEPIEFNKKYYCSNRCISNHLNSLSYSGVTHIIHQEYGPEHPVTKQIQKMNKELKEFRRIIDANGNRKRGQEYYFRRLEKSNKCL